MAEAPATQYANSTPASPVNTGLLIGTQTTAAAGSARRTEEIDGSAVPTVALAAVGADPGNRFLDPADADWDQGHAVTDSAPAGVTYSIPTDGSGVFTLHNDSGADIAIVGVPGLSDLELVVVNAGTTYTAGKESTTTAGTNAYLLQTARNGGEAHVFGTVRASSISVGPGTPAINVVTAETVDSVGRTTELPRYENRNLPTPDPDVANRFVDPKDQDWSTKTSPGVSYPVGLTYSVAADGSDAVTLHNESSTEVAILSAGSGLGLSVIGAGESFTIPAQASALLGTSMYLLQKPRVRGQPQVFGYLSMSPITGVYSSVSVADGTITLPRKGTDYASLDPANRFVDPSDPVSATTPTTPSYTDPQVAGISYSVDANRRVTVYNGGSDEIAVSRLSGIEIVDFVVIRRGESSTFSATKDARVNILSVQAPRDASGNPVYFGSITSINSSVPQSLPVSNVPAIPKRQNSETPPEAANHAPVLTITQTPSPTTGVSLVHAQTTDPDGDPVTLSVLSPPLGSVVSHSDGTFTYTPTAAMLRQGHASDAFTVLASDGRGGTTTETVVLDYAFTRINQKLVITVKKLSDTAFSVSAVDPDGGYIDWSNSASALLNSPDTQWDSVTHNQMTGWRMSNFVPADPNSSNAPGILGLAKDATATFELLPDLTRAHRGAYDVPLSFTLTDDGGDAQVVTIAGHVQFHNYAPEVWINTTESPYIFDVVTADQDGDPLDIAARTRNGGNVILLSTGQLQYVPRPTTNPYYRDTIDVTVSDGWASGSTHSESIFVGNFDSTFFPWLPSNTHNRVVIPSESVDEYMELLRNASSNLVDAHGELTIVERARNFLTLATLGYDGVAAFHDLPEALHKYSERAKVGRLYGLTALETSLLSDYAFDELPRRASVARQLEMSLADTRFFTLTELERMLHTESSVRVQQYFNKVFTQRELAERSARASTLKNLAVGSKGVKSVGFVGKVGGNALMAYSIVQATDDLINAKTDQERIDASFDLLAASAPVIGAATGCAIGAAATFYVAGAGCLAGAAVGFSAGSVVGVSMDFGLFYARNSENIKTGLNDFSTGFNDAVDMFQDPDFRAAVRSSGNQAIAQVKSRVDQGFSDASHYLSDRASDFGNKSQDFFNWVDDRYDELGHFVPGRR